MRLYPGLSRSENIRYEEKIQIVNREAKVTLLAVAVIVAVWCLLGFGLSGVPVRLFGIPLWAVTGTVGVWIFAVAVAIFLKRRVYADFSLDEGSAGDVRPEEMAGGQEQSDGRC